MTRVSLLFGMLLMALAACKKNEPAQLQVYIAEKDTRPGLHEAKFPEFANLGYIAATPDLTIAQLDRVTFAPSRVQKEAGKKLEDRTTLVLDLTKTDAEALNQLTSKHIGDRLLVLLNGEPLFAPEIRTPSVGESVYITPQIGADPTKIKEKLETLVARPK